MLKDFHIFAFNKFTPTRLIIIETVVKLLGLSLHQWVCSYNLYCWER